MAMPPPSRLRISGSFNGTRNSPPPRSSSRLDRAELKSPSSLSYPSRFFLFASIRVDSRTALRSSVVLRITPCGKYKDFREWTLMDANEGKELIRVGGKQLFFSRFYRELSAPFAVR